ncbi:hypothetical protein LguiA_026602 [Lonicera macranthoides]
MECKHDFTVKIIKNEVVAAMLPMQEHWLPPSNLDLLLPPLDFGVFFIYKNAPVEAKPVLKNALAEALVLYYAFAGEIMKNSAGEPELLCNNRGVDFTEAFADVELRDLNVYNPDESIEGRLVPLKKHGVLAVQITELKCMALVVACTFDHRVADAYSANMFLVSWAEIAQSKPLSQVPSFRRSLLYPRRPGSYCSSSIDRLYVPISTLKAPCTNDNQSIISRIYYIEAKQLCHLQSLASTNNRCKRSKLEAFSAFLWKVVAEDTPDNKTCKMGIVVDGRNKLRENDKRKYNPLATYFGNVLSIPYEEKRSDEIREMPLNWVANAVHDFLESVVTKDHFLGLIDWVEAHRPEQMLARVYTSEGVKDEVGSAVVVSSGQRFPVEKVDFGWGTPALGSYHFPWGGNTGYVMPMPSPLGNGDWLVYMHLFKSHIDLLETKASHVFRPLTCDYLEI